MPSQYLHALTANTLVTDVGARDNSQYNHGCDGLAMRMTRGRFWPSFFRIRPVTLFDVMTALRVCPVPAEMTEPKWKPINEQGVNGRFHLRRQSPPVEEQKELCVTLEILNAFFCIGMAPEWSLQRNKRELKATVHTRASNIQWAKELLQ